MQAEKKPLNLELILIILDAVLAVLFIGLVIANIIKANSQPTVVEEKEEESETSNTNSNTEDDPDADDSITTKRFNANIDGDLNTTLRLLSNYQSNNRGKLPATESEWKIFRTNYFKEEFKDKYTLKICNNELGNCEKPLSLTWANNANIVYAANYASCELNELKYTKNVKKIALYTHYKGETNGVTCVNN